MTTKRTTDKGPEHSGPNASKRIHGAPREVGPVWSLADHEKTRFDRVHGVSRILEQIHPVLHPDDREIMFNGLAAAIGFHDLSKMIDRLVFQDDSDDIREELEEIRVAFELSLQAMDLALGERATQFERARTAALIRHEKDPKQKAKAEAKELWNEWKAGKHPNIRRVEDFATEVRRLWPELTSAKVIEGWSAKWSKAAKNGDAPAC